MSAEDEFTTQYAIQLPDGSYCKQHPSAHHPLLWSEREHAEAYQQQLREAARSIGITHWTGRIMLQYCTPFVGENEPAEQLLSELELWLRKQDGGTT